MTEGPANRLAALRPRIKQRWCALLRDEPAPAEPSAVMFSRELLVFMLDDTLTRLTARLSTPQNDRARPPAALVVKQAHCPCGIQLLMSYYKAGEQAVAEVLQAETDPIRTKVLLDFRRIAHEEIKALTGVCRLRSGSECGLKSARPGA